MPAKLKKFHLRIDDDTEEMARFLGEHWSQIGDPLTPSVVIRECVRRVYTEITKKEAKGAKCVSRES